MGYFFADHVAASCGDRRFLAVRGAITDHADQGARSNVFLLVQRSWVFNDHANQSSRHFHLGRFLAIGHRFVKDDERVYLDHGTGTSVDARANDLLPRIFRRFHANGTFKVAKGVLCFNDDHGLSTQLGTFMRSEKRVYA